MREGYLGGSSSFFKFHVCPAIHLSLTSPSHDAQPSKIKPGEKVKRETAGVGAENPLPHSVCSLASCIQTKVLWSPLLMAG